ncbi:branched-chain amino acid ABC transporter permease [Oricola thermophila]|uniref:Branched-chain amino acid ABC transporter permease n=1 Tax=Oricola thermophila TaxID=2742145 RepID=A0A6N1V9K0_9HYPH|nr:branched-chain amino acid ABC transporter permease [Oricola thermophila]QKV17600.1 branched-chain amino acid ABC transporter permease [Oricola thermophila]
MDILVTGTVLGGTYALIALGLTLQYGVARIMNLANGENLVLACFCAFWLYTATSINPIFGIALIAPVAFVLNWAIYAYAMKPLVDRARDPGQLEIDSILATFGLMFIMQGIMLLVFGGEYFSYNFLSEPVRIFGENYGLNRIVALCAAGAIAVALYLFLYRTRQGTAVRAVSVNPSSASLVAIDVPRISAFAFALGGALTAAGGALLSTFYTFNASMGVIFTMKALIIVIMGGVGDVRGAVLAALLLGLAETAVATLIDPGLTMAATYTLFLLVLLFRPQGIFGRQTS